MYSKEFIPVRQMRTLLASSCFPPASFLICLSHRLLNQLQGKTNPFVLFARRNNLPLIGGKTNKRTQLCYI